MRSLSVLLLALAACGMDVRGLDASDARPAAAPDAGAGVPVVTLPAPDADAGVAEAPTVGTLSRPYHFRAPASYDPARPWPLLVMLHGYGATAELQDLYLGWSRLVDELGFLYAYPDGLTDPTLQHFWNATDACCDFYGNPVDDVAYVASVIDDVAARYHVDPARVYVMGHSNGGFMAHRLACDLADKVTAVASLAGATWLDASKCDPAQPVSVLEIHGTLDPVILYGGGQVILAPAGYPAATTTVADWARLDGCAAGPASGAALDLDLLLLGKETSVSRYEGCAAGTDVELWTIHGGGHVPVFNGSAMRQVWAWLAKHTR